MAEKCGWRQSKSSTAAAGRRNRSWMAVTCSSCGLVPTRIDMDAWSRSFVSVTANSRKYWSSGARRGSRKDRRQGVRRYPVAFRKGCVCCPARSLGRPQFRPFAAGTSQPDCSRAGPICTVEGKVLSVRESGATIYLIFGRWWTRDFTVTILKRHRREFAAAVIDPKGLEGRPIRVRGWVEHRGGPVIDVVAPKQIERV